MRCSQENGACSAVSPFVRGSLIPGSQCLKVSAVLVCPHGAISYLLDNKPSNTVAHEVDRTQIISMLRKQCFERQLEVDRGYMLVLK